MGTALLPGKWVLLLSPSFLHLGIMLLLLNWNMGSKLTWISSCSLNTGRIFWQLLCTGQCPAAITDWFSSSFWNTNGRTAACGCRNSLSCCSSYTSKSHLGFGSGKNVIWFSSLVDCDVALLQFARTSSKLLPVGMPAGCAFLTSSINDLMAKLVMPAVYISFS